MLAPSPSFLVVVGGGAWSRIAWILAKAISDPAASLAEKRGRRAEGKARRGEEEKRRRGGEEERRRGGVGGGRWRWEVEVGGGGGRWEVVRVRVG